MNTDKLYLNGVDIQSQYGLWLNWRVLSAPKPQLDYQLIPGKHGSIDLSEALGDVYYDDRTIKIDMTHLDGDWYADYESFVSDYHGKVAQIKFENDPDWYWYGRIVVSDYSAKSHRMTVNAIVHPFKFAISETVITKEVTAATEQTAHTVELTNGRMTVTPKVTVEGSTNGVHLKWGDMTAVVSNGSSYVTGLTLNKGTLNVLVWGSGTVTFTYRQGAL